MQDEIKALDRMAYWGADMGATRALVEWLREASEVEEIQNARRWLKLRCDKYEGKRWLEWRRRRMEDAPRRCEPEPARGALTASAVGALEVVR